MVALRGIQGSRDRWLAVALFVSALFLIPSFALAGRNAGGALIVHTNDAVNFSPGGDYCGTQFDNPGSCENAITRTDKDEDHAAVIWVLAAFPTGSSPAVTAVQFGLDDNLPEGNWETWGKCRSGVLEIPDTGWPTTGKGTALAYTSAVTDTLFPIYWFAVDGFAGPPSAYLGTTNYILGNGLAQFADNSDPPVTDDITHFGTVRWYEAGSNDCPSTDSQDSPGGRDSASGSSPDEPGISTSDLAFVEITPAADSTFTHEIRGLESDYGLRILLTMIPDVVICAASDDQLSRLGDDSRVSLATRSPITSAPPLSQTTLQPGDAGLGRSLWNYLLNPATPETSSYRFSYSCGLLPDSTRGDVYPERDANRQTSAFMMGKVGLSLIFPESQQSGPCAPPNYPEDWTLSERNQVLGEFTQGLVEQGLAAMDARAQVTFEIYDFVLAPTTVEPIQGTSDSEVWGKETLAYMGYGSGDLKTRAYALNNDRRRSWQTDWWYTAFVVRDVCDADGAFSDGKSAFAYVYGPHLVVTTKNGGYGINNLDYIVAHETSHIFGANDEYSTSDCAQHCSDTYGYLHVPTANCYGCTSQQESCIMNSLVRPFRYCASSAGQVGWRDSDSPQDGVFDPIEQPTASASMRFQATTVYPGDFMDVWTLAGDWVKRVALSTWDADRGGALWDGFNYAGFRCAPDTYVWKKNNTGNTHSDYLLPEQYAPVLSDVTVVDGNPPHLRFEFVDDDTYCGRVRATTHRLGRPDKYPIGDKFYIDTYGSQPPIDVPLDLSNGYGLYRIEVRVWDDGGGRVDDEVVDYAYGGSAGVGEGGLRARTPGPGYPNPSAGIVHWRVPSGGDKITTLAIFGVDGRLVRRIEAVSPAKGNWTILWDGRDEGGHSVACGRYFLRSQSAKGTRDFGSVTIAR